MKSPCHNVEMVGGSDMLCCPTCGKWYKSSDLAASKADLAQAEEMMRMMGIDPSTLRKK